MTGLEALRDEMRKRGLTPAQIESHVAAVVLDILSKDPNNTANGVWETEKLMREKKHELEYLERSIRDLRSEAAAIEKKMMEERQELRGRYVEQIQYIRKFNDGLAECETDEGRDAMRRAQLFVNTVNVDTKYDNTAFIIGLASILCNGHVAPMEELKKINPKLLERSVLPLA